MLGAYAVHMLVPAPARWAALQFVRRVLHSYHNVKKFKASSCGAPRDTPHTAPFLTIRVPALVFESGQCGIPRLIPHFWATLNHHPDEADRRERIRDFAAPMVFLLNS